MPPLRANRHAARRNGALVLGLFLLVALVPLYVGNAVTPITEPKTYANPVFSADFPDPFILRYGNTYFAYGTNSGWGNVPIMQSEDLVNWTFVREALPLLPTWAQPGYSWAPSVLARGGTFVLYYSALEQRSQRMCIGRAVALHPGGPFRDESTAPLVCTRRRGGSIDPSPVMDGDALWLLFKSEDNVLGGTSSIWSVRLTMDGLTTHGSPVELLRADQPWESGVVESPVMTRDDGRYHLFYSGGPWDSSSYAIGYAVCQRITGPCRKPTPHPMAGSRGRVAGPGGQSVFRDAFGRPWMAYHAWDSKAVGYPFGRRALHIDRLEFRAGWPLLHGPSHGSVPLHGTPTHPAVALVPSPTGQGYRLVASDGDVFIHGDARFLGSTGGNGEPNPFVAAASLPAADGYWLLTSTGRVYAFGFARHHGDLGDRAPHPVVDIVPSRTGLGYWLVDSAGVVHAFGDAGHYGDLRWRRIPQPIVAAAAAPTGHGYWLVDRLGRVYSYADAHHVGDLRQRRLHQPIVDLAATSSGFGYWLVQRDGRVHGFGDGLPLGDLSNTRLRYPVAAITASPAGGGYWLATNDGYVDAFGAARDHGSTRLPGR